MHHDLKVKDGSNGFLISVYDDQEQALRNNQPYTTVTENTVVNDRQNYQQREYNNDYNLDNTLGK